MVKETVYQATETRPEWKADTLRSRTDRVAMGKYDRTEEQDMQIVSRVHELAKRYGVKMSQIAIAWHLAKGVASRERADTTEAF